MSILFILMLCVFLATLVGGLFALRFKDKLHLILGFSAGAVIGVAFFDLIPEALELGSGFYSTSNITSFVALGFILFMILDRFVILHSHSSTENYDDNIQVDKHEDENTHTHPKRGLLGASSLSIHSFIDGIAIGLAFQISPAVGVVVAVAVLVHDFSDGINTVSLIMKNGGSKLQAFRWLIIDAIAPVLGIISTLFFSLPQKSLAVILAIFAGFFVYIGASDLLPESHHNHPTIWTTVVTILGMSVLYIVIFLAGI